MLQNLLALSIVGIPAVVGILAAADFDQQIEGVDVSDASGAVRWPVSE